VLCKAIAAVPGYLTFFSNYRSAKGAELDRLPRAAAVMHWDHLHRQVRIEGAVIKADVATSDEYFASRHWQSRVGAWASQQSQPISSRAELLRAVDDHARRLGIPASAVSQPDSVARDIVILRPPHWGGYHLWADRVELWVEGSARIHDRVLWTRALTREADRFIPGPWATTRLQP
jgi:pyridoxamine 5'-phosphate oxidase